MGNFEGFSFLPHPPLKTVYHESSDTSRGNMRTFVIIRNCEHDLIKPNRKSVFHLYHMSPFLRGFWS